MANSSREDQSQAVTRRASISLPADLYQELERIAKLKKVSLAWVVRDAAETYVETKRPLLKQER